MAADGSVVALDGQARNFSAVENVVQVASTGAPRALRLDGSVIPILNYSPGLTPIPDSTFVALCPERAGQVASTPWCHFRPQHEALASQILVLRVNDAE